MAEPKTEFLISARDETQAAFRSVEAGLSRVNAALGGMFGPLAALASVAGFGALIKSQIDLGDQLNKTSQKLGIAVEDLSAYQYAAKLSDVSNEQLTGGLAKLARTMQDAAGNKTGEAATAFRALGVSVTDTAGNLRPLNLVLDEVSARFEQTRDGTNKTAMAMQLFGRSGAEMIPLLNSLRGLSDEARRTGNIVSTEFAKKSEQFKDSMTRMERASGNFARTIGTVVVPVLAEMMERMNVAIGAQESLSLDVLGKDRARLAREYTQLTQAGLSVQSARAQYLIKQIDEVDTKIIAANQRLAAIKSKTPAGAPIEMPSIARAAEVEGIGDKEAKQTEKYQSELAKQIAALQISTAPVIEQLQLKHEAQQLVIDSAWQQGLITDTMWQDLGLQSRQTFEETRSNMELQYQQKRTQQADAARAKEYGSQFAWQGQVNALMQGSFNQQLQGTGMMLGQLSSLMLSSKKKEFEVGKKAAIGQALVSTYLGVASALSYGFPLGLIFAAISLAAGMANVNKIRSQKFGGGGGASPVYPAGPGGIPSPAESGRPEPVAPSLPQAAQSAGGPRVVNITLQSDSGLLSSEYVRNVLIPGINDAVGDGVTLRTMAA